MARVTTTGSSPGFVADHGSVVRNTGRQILWASVPDKYRTTAVLVKLNGAASADATSLTVDALSGAIPAGTLLHFGESKEFARVTVAAAAGATSLTVEALPAAIEDNDEAYYAGDGVKRIKAGTIMAELAGGKIIPRAAVTGAETSIGLLISDAEEGAVYAAISGHGVFIGGLFYDELLPETGHASFDTWIGEINTAGPGIRLETYSDSRAS